MKNTLILYSFIHCYLQKHACVQNTHRTVVALTYLSHTALCVSSLVAVFFACNINVFYSSGQQDTLKRKQHVKIKRKEHYLTSFSSTFYTQ